MRLGDSTLIHTEQTDTIKFSPHIFVAEWQILDCPQVLLPSNYISGTVSLYGLHD